LNAGARGSVDFGNPLVLKYFGDSVSEIKLPKLTSLPDNKVSKPTWLPTCLTDLAPDEPNSRLERVARMMLAK
jgi:hypothetical protein